MQGYWTEEDYFALDTKRLVELSEGRLTILPRPTIAHQLVLGFVSSALRAFVQESDPRGIVLFAPLCIRLWPGKIREPDVVYLHPNHRSRARKQHTEGADLVMEVVSPSKSDHDRNIKRIEYAQASISEYWLVDPQKRHIIVYALEGKAYGQAGLYGAGTVAPSVLLPGWSVVVDEVLKEFDEAP